MQVTTIGLDIAKQVFFAVGTDRQGRQVWRKRLRRGQVVEFFAQQAPCRVGMEACGGAQYWARQLQAQGHAVKVMAPRHVKAFRRGQKNDYNDAGALCEAARQPAVRGVPLKSAAQQDLQTLHRVRDGLVRQRTATVNQVRGLLAEQGIVLAAGIGRFRQLVPQILEQPAAALSGVLREVVAEAYAWVQALDARIKGVEQQLAAASQADAAVARLRAVPGFGPLVTTALVGAVGDGRTFGAGRGVGGVAGAGAAAAHHGRQAAAVRDHQAGRQTAAGVTDSWRAGRGAPRHAQSRPVELLDSGSASAPGDQCRHRRLGQ